MPTTRRGVAPRGLTDRRVAAARAAIENLRPHELAAELGDVAIFLVDVRGRDECGGGRIAGSINIPRGTIETATALLPEVTSRIVLYCDTGARSALAAAALYDLGFVDVAHLDGGLAAWCDCGQPTVVLDDES